MSSPFLEVERFFGEENSAQLVHVVRNAPLEQLCELAKSIDDRQYVRGSMKDIGIAPDQLLIRDDYSSPFSNQESLRLLILYSPKVVVSDPIRTWARIYAGVCEYEYKFTNDDGSECQIELARILDGLLPISDLIRTGTVHLIPDPLTLREQTKIPEFCPWDNEGTFAFLQYPALDRIALRLLNIPNWELITAGLMTKKGNIPNNLVSEALEYGLVKTYGEDWRDADEDYYDDLRRRTLTDYGLTGDLNQEWKSLSEAIILGNCTQYLGKDGSIVPLATNALVEKHLLASSKSHLDAGITQSDNGRLTKGASAAINFGIPSYTTLPLTEIIRLRQNEELFAEFRESLLSVMEEVLKMGEMDSRQFTNQVAETANELLTSTVESLSGKSKRKRFRSNLIREGVGSVVSLGISGIISARFPEFKSLSDDIGSRFGSIAGQKAARKTNEVVGDLDTMNRVLLSLATTGK